MTIMADSRDTCTCRHTPKAPLAVDPTVPPSVDVVPVGPRGKALMPVLVLPDVRVCVDGFSTDIDASEWWKDLAVAAIYASLCYQGGIEPTR